MKMLRNHSNTDLDDGPHTLRSGLHSPEVSILRQTNDSLSLISNSLEISQSPTRTLLQDSIKKQSLCTSIQTPCTTSIICNERSQCKHVVFPENPTNSCTINQEKIQQLSGPLCSASEKIEKPVSVDKNVSEQISLYSSQTVPDPANLNLPDLVHTFSPDVTNKVNPLSETTSDSSCNLVPEHTVSSISKPPSIPVYSSITSQQFFSFVIFHAPEDQVIASRVCNVLELLGVGKGTTFCEGFETPGVSPLTCLENAVENSAYIILLLTNAFLQTTWGGFQSTTAMMNSIENAHKMGSVIPFYPCSKKPDGKIPLWIKSLLPLDENSPVFKDKVRRTFKQNVIRDQFERWRQGMQSTTDFLCFQQQQNITLQWPMADTNMLPQQTQPPLTVCHGQTPIIHISNVENVQIGNQNSMNVQFSPNGQQMDCDTNNYQGFENDGPN
ncbi:uncharacterized protein [Pyxicephalus adspersus]|uniref:uncharacterized protein n=1 Tax=Pyxicephalus adspersus TaxID=30357 RepID=UPI003B5C419B